VVRSWSSGSVMCLCLYFSLVWKFQCTYKIQNTNELVTSDERTKSAYFNSRSERRTLCFNLLLRLTTYDSKLLTLITINGPHRTHLSNCFNEFFIFIRSFVQDLDNLEFNRISEWFMIIWLIEILFLFLYLSIYREK